MSCSSGECRKTRRKNLGSLASPHSTLDDRLVIEVVKMDKANYRVQKKKDDDVRTGEMLENDERSEVAMHMRKVVSMRIKYKGNQ